MSGAASIGLLVGGLIGYVAALLLLVFCPRLTGRIFKLFDRIADLLSRRGAGKC